MVFQNNNEFGLETSIWDKVLTGDLAAFESVVISNQSAVTAVVFSIIGDFPISQDISQETFWAAWENRSQLRESRKLKSWLCGIARNLAKQWCRKNRSTKKPAHHSLEFEPAALQSESEDLKVSEEEQAMVWRSLESIPESYREVLVLYYRQDHSISEVANALEISQDAARQRLSRGRNLLRGEVARMVEDALGKSDPGPRFTGCVMAGLIGSQGLGKIATTTVATGMSGKAVGGIATSALKAGATVGLLGALTGIVGGLGGAFLGVWLPAQFVPTETERQLLLTHVGKMMFAPIIFTFAIVAIVMSIRIFDLPQPIIFVLILSTILVFISTTVWQTIRIQMLVSKIRKEINPEKDPNQSWLAKRNPTRPMKAQHWIGRRYTSKWALLGIPLVHFNLSDLRFGVPLKPASRLTARGWIAIGDNARGILIGMGHRASGLIAVGGVSVGLISIGGVAYGGIAFGGVAIGAVSVGGLAVGLIAVGGAALGYVATGGLALAWHSAVGGAAFAFYVAEGGFALARDFAVGGAAIAAESNTEAAQHVAQSQPIRSLIEFYLSNKSVAWLIILLTSIGPLWASHLMKKLMYETVQNPKSKPVV